MVKSIREAFNANFQKEIYRNFLRDLESAHPGAIEFRVAETPIFVPAAFTKQLIDTCEHIIDIVLEPDFKSITERAIPPAERVPEEQGYPQFIAFDFGICEKSDGSYEPQLIEMQGFPSLYAFQIYYPAVLEKYFPIPHGYSHYLGKFTRDSYTHALRETILGGYQPEEVILLELMPEEQKTRIDFYCTEDYVGIEPVCLTDLIPEGRQLYYIHSQSGKKVRIRRVYNRIIFDDLHAKRDELGEVIDLTQPWDVEWVPHPNWFYRISKFTLPFIKHPNVPPTYFLNEVKQPPTDLENYVLKPLFSFAGQGVIIDLAKEDLEKISDPENWILQKKVKYGDVIQTPDTPAKAEIRVMYLWQEGAPRPVAAVNLARLSKGKMIGVRYNKDKEWVGGSVCYFEKPVEKVN